MTVDGWPQRADAAAGGGPPMVLMIRLDVDPGGDLVGLIGPPEACSERFEGWLGLMAALTRVIRLDAAAAKVEGVSPMLTPLIVPRFGRG